MAGSLDEAWEKIRRARQHFDLLRAEIEPINKGDTYSIALDIDANTGKYSFRVEDLPPLNPDWGLIVGDCIHNARTALDYLAVQLAALVTGQDPRSITTVQFPIYSEPKRFAGVLSDLRNNPAFSGYLTRIEELQPFNWLNSSVWGMTLWGETAIPAAPALPHALDRLARLDNMDKHRVIHAVWVGGNAHMGHPIEFPDGFKLATGDDVGFGPLKDDAEIGGWRFETPLPYEWHPDEVDVKRHFPIEVALDEPAPMKGVLEILPFCLWAAEAVLWLFDPVFKSHGTPLPVTASLTWQ